MDRRFSPHLEHISDALKGISEISFSKPGLFTNSQIHPPTIVTLLRDTEQYERALFSLPKSSTFPSAGKIAVAAPPRRHTAIGMVLGGDMVEQIKHAEAKSGDGKNQINVHVLLDGAEKLVNVYPIPGAIEKIEYLRHRFTDLKDSIVLYEEIVAEQQIQLELQRESDSLVEENDYSPQIQGEIVTDNMIAMEEEQIKLLEARRDHLDLELRRIEGSMKRISRSDGTI